MTTLGQCADVKIALADHAHSLAVELTFPIPQFLQVSSPGLISGKFWGELFLEVFKLLKVAIRISTIVIFNRVLYT